MNIKIEGTETLERIATALERIAAALEKPSTETPAQIPESVKPAPAEDKAPEPQPAEPETPPFDVPAAVQPEEAEPTITLEQIRQQVVQLSATGAKDAVRAIVTEYGRNVSAIPQEKYGEVMERLNAVKKEA